MHEHLLVGLVTLIALGAGSQLLAAHIRVPSILVLLVVGFLAGPVLGVVVPGDLLGEITLPLVSLGAAIILFEGGLSARIQDMKAIRGPVVRLITVGLLSTWILSSAIAHFAVGFSISLSALLGAILVVTGPTVIGPLLRHSRPGANVARILKYEGIINDPLGAILALLVFQVIEVERVETAASLVAWGVLRAFLASAALGVAGSALFAHGRRHSWIPQDLENAVLIPLVLTVYVLANLVQPEAGLLAVTVMGMVLASKKDLDIEANLVFSEHLRTILISVLFILLTARITREDISAIPWGAALFVVAMIAVVRPVSVFLSTFATKLSMKERTFLALMAPRGIVAAAVSSVFAIRLVEDGFAQANQLMPITFLMISVGVAVYGLGARPLVRILQLDRDKPSGFLLLGSTHLSLRIAEALQACGHKPTLISSERREVLRLRRLGFDAHFGQVHAQHLLDRLDLEQIGFMLALTPSDEINTLGCVHFGRLLGRDAVAQVKLEDRPIEGEQDDPSALRGAELGGGEHYTTLLRMSEVGAVKVTPLTEEFTYDDYLAHYEGKAVPLLLLSPNKVPQVIDETTTTEPGDEVLSLLPADFRKEVDAA